MSLFDIPLSKMSDRDLETTLSIVYAGEGNYWSIRDVEKEKERRRSEKRKVNVENRRYY